MTNGLTKSAKVEFLPAVPATPAIAPFSERFFLTPSPRGMYYVRDGAGYVLKTGSSGSSSNSNGYRLPANSLNGVPNERGEGEPIFYLFPPEAAVSYNFVSAIGDTVAALTIIAFADANGVIVAPPDTPPDMFLAWYYVLPKSTAPAPSPGNVYALPSGTYPIRFLGIETLANGFPTVPGTYVGTADIPNAAGGTRPFSMMFAPNGPSGAYVPVNTLTPLPAYTQLRPSPYYQMVMTNFPGAPGFPRQPVTPVFKAVRAWDAGANSIATVDSTDVYTKFQVGLSLGVKIGFYDDTLERNPADAAPLRAAFYCFSSAQGFRWAVLDDGRQLTFANNTYTADTVFEIRRIGSRVMFLVDDVEVYATTNKLPTAVRVGTAMYSTGDFVL